MPTASGGARRGFVAGRATLAGLQLPNPPPAVRPFGTSCAPIGLGTPGRSWRCAGLFGKPARRVSPQLAQGAGSTRHRIPGPQGRDLRPRLLLASLPALLPEPAEVELSLLGPKVRAQSRTRRAQGGDLEAAGWTVIEAWECDVRDRLGEVTIGGQRTSPSGVTSSCGTPNTSSNVWQSSPFSSATARISSYRARTAAQSFKSRPTTTVGS